MQVLFIVSLSALVLLVLAFVAIMLPAVFSFRPFDHHRVGYRSGVLYILAMMFTVLTLSLYERTLTPLRVEAVVEFFVMMLIAALLGLLFAIFNYRGMRSLSQTYAKREAILTERRQRERDGEPDQTRA